MQAAADSAPFGDAEACGTGLTASGLLNAASPPIWVVMSTVRQSALLT